MNALKQHDDTELTQLEHDMVMVLVNHALLAQGIRAATPLHEKYVARVEAFRTTMSPNEFAFAEIGADNFFQFMREAGLLQSYIKDMVEVCNAYSK